jgi:nicotinamidase-related amidase
MAPRFPAFGRTHAIRSIGQIGTPPAQGRAMAKTSPQDHVPDNSHTVLILIDVINDFEFPGGEKLFRYAYPAARRIKSMKQAMRARGVPTIYANDNFGRWKSDFREVLDHCLEEGVRGKPVAELLRPGPEDYFVLKPKYSAFYGSALDTLLRYLGARELVLAGFAGDICVLFSASDARMRDYSLRIPRDCIASESIARNRRAIGLLGEILGVDVTPWSRQRST